ncbi:glycosyltransferase family 2 protein [Candidatus Kaiserbacteria bacterium]|nr:glycosyltransferase family 2 protein [Candidatus Kaiserbacteria bacterium]
MPKQSWSIVVFCFNEVGAVEEVVRRIINLFDEHRKDLYEVLVVDDGSTDGSYEKIVALHRARSDVVGVIRHQKNLGIGPTLIDGYRSARNENLTAIPADGQFDVRELQSYLNVEDGTFVSFYRLENVQYSTFRSLLSAANKWVNRYFNGIELKDVNWVKVYKRSTIMSFPWKLSSSLIESEICAKLLLCGMRPIEVLSYYHPRQSGKSKGASLVTIFRALRETPKLIWAVRSFGLALKKTAKT